MKNKQNTQIDTAQLDTFLQNAFCAMGSLALALDQINNLLPRNAQVTTDTSLARAYTTTARYCARGDQA